MTMTPVQAPVIETERLRLRLAGPDDFQPLAEFYASDRARFVGGPLDAAATWRVLAVEIGHWNMRGYGRFAIEERSSGAFCGIVGPWCPLGWPEPEIGWDLMAGFEGRGYATEAGRAARQFAYGTLGWKTAISLIALGNDGSRGVAKRLGATHEGMYQHAMFGELEVWRHPSPEDVQ